MVIFHTYVKLPEGIFHIPYHDRATETFCCPNLPLEKLNGLHRTSTEVGVQHYMAMDQYQYIPFLGG